MECWIRSLPFKRLRVRMPNLWKYLQILSFPSVCSLMGNCFDTFHWGLHNKLRQKRFVCVVLISLVDIWACQNCISGFPCLACSGCSIRKEVENVLVDDFSENKGASIPESKDPEQSSSNSLENSNHWHQLVRLFWGSEIALQKLQRLWVW